MNDDRIEQAESESLEVAHAGDKHEKDKTPEDATGGDDAEEAHKAELPPIARNVVRTTSPYAPDDIHEGQTFEQKDPATLRAREAGELLIH